MTILTFLAIFVLFIFCLLIAMSIGYYLGRNEERLKASQQTILILRDDEIIHLPPPPPDMSQKHRYFTHAAMVQAEVEAKAKANSEKEPT